MNGRIVGPVEPENPALLYPYSGTFEGPAETFNGCNHCGRHVPVDSWRIEWHGPHLRRPLAMHAWCFKKLYQREYCKALFGRDIFAGA